ncbi:hypothetical protein ACOSQ2_013237 [Xanthoceras sorbifolium]
MLRFRSMKRHRKCESSVSSSPPESRSSYNKKQQIRSWTCSALLHRFNFAGVGNGDFEFSLMPGSVSTYSHL